MSILNLMWLFVRRDRYMTDVPHGGETFFPRSGALSHPPDPRCEDEAGMQGMKVTPSRGKALLFYSLRPDGAVDPFSLHGGCPVGAKSTLYTHLRAAHGS
eukprot:COSAG05_NODE_191_length_14617_cov_90.240736_5_plen_100_part_00